MDTGIEQKISNLIKTQFPAFYRDEGPTFIEFVRAYYAWLEEENNTINKARNILVYRDIDKTPEAFLLFFQKKYLYGIPFDVIINKRLLLKRVLDAYRSKSSLQCYKLLFRLIYNQDMELYLPGVDILKVSDGTWKELKYLEVNNVDGLGALVGKKIYGLQSKSTAIVESFITEPIDNNIIGTLYISNINPRGGNFIKGEKLVDYSFIGTDQYIEKVNSGPIVMGSLSSLRILNGGQGFSVGDILKVVKRDLTTNEILSSGINGLMRVTDTTTGSGTLSFNILEDGFGYSDDSLTFLYNNPLDTTGQNATFEVGQLSNQKTISYNTDLIANYLDKTLNTSTYLFPGDNSANLSSVIGTSLSYNSKVFGSIRTLDNINIGSDYTGPPSIFVKEPLLSLPMSGDISYSSGNVFITGINTTFTNFLSNNDLIFVQANNSNSDTIEYHIIKEVANDTNIEVYGTFEYTSTASAEYRIAPELLQANYEPLDPSFSPYELKIATLEANPLFGNGVVSEIKAINSGKSYLEGEVLELRRTGGITIPTIENAGTNYSNGDILIFYGGDPIAYPEGFVTTNGSGNITLITITNFGSLYKSSPTVEVKSKTGSGAILKTTIEEYNTLSAITGTVLKSGIGINQGYWTTTRGFLNSDKYIQDSYFYQDYSYQIRTASTLEQYKDIFYETFHISGTEMFGEYRFINTISSPITLTISPSDQ